MSTETKDEKNNATNIKNRKVATLQLIRSSSGRDPRSRLFSDSSEELPRGILKNARVPTKRSASECVDDLSQIMADLDLNFDDISKANNQKFCPYHHSYFIEEDDECTNDEKADRFDDDEHEDDADDDGDDDETDKGSDSSHNGGQKTNNRNNSNKERGSRKCDCLTNYRDDEKPTKSVRFDERVYELRIASRLYDRRAFTKYRLSTRHHPLSNQNHNNNSSGNGKSKNKKKRNNGDSNNKNNNSNAQSKSNSNTSSSTNGPENQSIKKQTKSQRAKQSKKAKKKLQNMKRDEHSTDTGSDDQGYCSSLQSFSD